MTTLEFGDGVAVFYILGGPGAGKGTQCGMLAKTFNFSHLSAGDLLRAERDRKDSPHQQYINDVMKQGGMVPDTLIVTLLKDAMKQAFHTHHGQTGWENGRGRFLIDGFPRTMEQAMLFEREICVPDMTILFDTTEELMLKRVLERAATSGRVDDNAEVMTKRFKSYQKETQPVLDYLRTCEARSLPAIPNVEIIGKVAQIDSTRPPSPVDHDASSLIKAVLALVE